MFGFWNCISIRFVQNTLELEPGSIKNLAQSYHKDDKPDKKINLNVLRIFSRIYLRGFTRSTHASQHWDTMDGRQLGKKAKCLKLPSHIPQLMNKLPLKCIH